MNMFMYRVISSAEAAGWLVLLAALLVVPVTFAAQVSSSRTGLLATLPGAVLTETLLALVLLVGYAIRVRSRHDTLAQLTDSVIRGIVPRIRARIVQSYDLLGSSLQAALDVAYWWRQ
jgi:hypothetical protein